MDMTSESNLTSQKRDSAARKWVACLLRAGSPDLGLYLALTTCCLGPRAPTEASLPTDGCHLVPVRTADSTL